MSSIIMVALVALSREGSSEKRATHRGLVQNEESDWQSVSVAHRPKVVRHVGMVSVDMVAYASRGQCLAEK
jgi:hypothetical protein